MQQFAIDKLNSLVDQVRAKGKRVTVVEPGSPLWNEFAKRLEPLAAAAKKTYSPDVQAVVAKN